MAFLDIVNTYGDLAYKKGTHCGIEQVYTHVPEGTEHKQPLLFIVVMARMHLRTPIITQITIPVFRSVSNSPHVSGNSGKDYFLPMVWI